MTVPTVRAAERLNVLTVPSEQQPHREGSIKRHFVCESGHYLGRCYIFSTEYWEEKPQKGRDRSKKVEREGRREGGRGKGSFPCRCPSKGCLGQGLGGGGGLIECPSQLHTVHPASLRAVPSVERGVPYTKSRKATFLPI